LGTFYEKRLIANWRKLSVLLKDEFLVQVEEIEAGSLSHY